MHSIIYRIIILGALFHHTVINAQRYDFNWIFGYDGGKGDPRFGTTIVNFNSGNPRIEFEPLGKLVIFDANASISTIDGRLLYYTNGYELEDSSYNKIGNALDIKERYWDALIANQGVLFLPISNNHYVLFYINLEQVNVKFLLTSLKFIELNDKNKVISSGIALKDTLNDGFLTMSKHANGRDWWLILNKLNTNFFYKLFISNGQIVKVDTQSVGPNIIDGFGQAIFSPNGEYFATIEGISFSEGLYIYLYKFDRCTGKLDFVQNKNFKTTGYSGISFSPNSRYLYYSQNKLLFQFELNNSSPLSSEILLDSIIDQTPPWGSSFNIHQLGPDGRIYITNGFSNFYQHVINYPDKAGLECSPRSNGFKLKTLNDHGISNNPNYRLGPIDGSICDTLGIDNIPWAWWRHEQDSVDYLRFEFTDLSAYEVTDWSWTFGDGSNSIERHPMHRYKDKGVYEVCLIASNKNGSDTLCRTLNVGITLVDNVVQDIKIELFPNPCDDYFIINVLNYIPEKMTLTLTDLSGRKVLSKRLYEGSNGLDVEELSKGVYIITIVEQGMTIKSEKVIKI